MTGLTDFQTAMVVLFGIVLVFSLALAAQGRRPAGTGRPGLPKDRVEAMADDIAELRSKQAEAEKRQIETDHSINQMRTMMGALPSIKAFHDLELKVTAMDGKVDVNHAVALATSRAVERIEKHLMKVD